MIGMIAAPGTPACTARTSAASRATFGRSAHCEVAGVHEDRKSDKCDGAHQGNHRHLPKSSEEAFPHRHVAEQWATLDLLSGGRVDWAAGRGYDRREYLPFGIDFNDNQSIFEEGMALVQRLWAAGGSRIS